MPYAIQSEIPEDDCAICTETLKNPGKAVFRLACGHFFHNDCLNDYCNHYYPNTSCPLCRAEFDEMDCNTFYAFKEGSLKVNSLPQEVKNIYFTLHPELAQEHEGGKRKNKSKRHTKRAKKVKRKSIRRKRF